MNRSDDDDNDNFELTPNGTRILRDGGRARVSLMDAQPVRLHDGRGKPVGQRPGFVVSDASVRDDLEQAYSDYETDLVAAYKNPLNSRRVPDTRDPITMDEILARYVRELRNG